jgi:hypothetical protein
MDIFIQKDKEDRDRINKEGYLKEFQKEIDKQKQILEEQKMGDLLLWTPKDIEKPRNFKPEEKIARERFNKTLTEKAEIKDTKCWMHTMGCSHNPIAWVREIQFDMKNQKAGINHSQVDTRDYDGPIPGFCLGHIATAPAQLAQAVYFDQTAMIWGLKPKRWFVIFTDGTKQGGECIQLDPKQIQPEIKEEFIQMEKDDE